MKTLQSVNIIFKFCDFIFLHQIPECYFAIALKLFFHHIHSAVCEKRNLLHADSTAMARSQPSNQSFQHISHAEKQFCVKSADYIDHILKH